MNTRTVKVGFLTLIGAAAALVVTAPVHGAPRSPISHVLLLSIDGFHASDLAWYLQDPPDGSALAYLSAHGRTYTHASATRPSDSFPGFLAMITGGTPGSTGVYYDDSFDRALVPASGTCTPGAPPPGTRAQWKQNLDKLPFTGFLASIDPTKLPRNPSDCSRVMPHQFPQVNNIFELIKAAGGSTAWSDKHPAYEFTNGLSGTGVDDLYAPEIASCGGVLPCPPGAQVTTNSFQATMDYDDMKVAAILNEIGGLDHTGTTAVGVPTLFGMNFQAVSVGQKLDMTTLGGDKGGYLDANGTPSGPLQTALRHVDDSIGSMISALRGENLLGSTLIIVSAKHGNSPIDPSTLARANPDAISAIVNAVPNLVNGVQVGLLAQLSADTGPLIWLKNSSRTQDVVNALKAADHSVTRIDASAPGDGVLWGDALTTALGSNSRTPDIVLLPIPGTVYTTAVTKIADHGSFYEDDVHVAMVVSNGAIQHTVIDDPVETRQIACTILTALSLNCGDLTSQQNEPSAPLTTGDISGTAPRK
jgi:type I phosphodiesterase/nucleotide pyrophosphatase